MSKYRELHPSAHIYIETLFSDSKKFDSDISKLKEKFSIKRGENEGYHDYIYGDKIMFFAIAKDVALDRYEKIDLELYLIFNKEIEKISKKYFIDKYIKELKEYILGRGFQPLFQRTIKVNKNGIQIDFPLSVTRAEYNDMWKEVQTAKDFARGNLINGEGKIRDKKRESTEFDTKLALYKMNHTGYVLDKYEKIKIDRMEEVQKKKWLNEIHLALGYLNKP